MDGDCAQPGAARPRLDRLRRAVQIAARRERGRPVGGGLRVPGGARLALRTAVQRPRRVYADGCFDRHDHGRQRLPRDHPEPEEGRGRPAGRPGARSGARRAGQAALDAQQLSDAAGAVPDDQQPLSDELREPLELADLRDCAGGGRRHPALLQRAPQGAAEPLVDLGRRGGGHGGDRAAECWRAVARRARGGAARAGGDLRRRRGDRARPLQHVPRRSAALAGDGVAAQGRRPRPSRADPGAGAAKSTCRRRRAMRCRPATSPSSSLRSVACLPPGTGRARRRNDGDAGPARPHPELYGRPGRGRRGGEPYLSRGRHRAGRGRPDRSPRRCRPDAEKAARRHAGRRPCRPSDPAGDDRSAHPPAADPGDREPWHAAARLAAEIHLRRGAEVRRPRPCRAHRELLPGRAAAQRHHDRGGVRLGACRIGGRAVRRSETARHAHHRRQGDDGPRRAGRTARYRRERLSREQGADRTLARSRAACSTRSRRALR